MFRCCSLILLILILGAQAFAQDRRPSLMVLPLVLEDSQGSRTWVAQAFQESLSTEAGRKQIAVVVTAPDRVAPPRELRDALAIARDNRADLVLFGLCTLDDQTVRVSAQLGDVASGREIGKLHASGGVRDIIDMQDDLYRQLRGLVLDVHAPAVVIETPAPLPVQSPVEPDPLLSYRPTYDYSGSAYAGTGYGYYPDYAPMYLYEPDYVYAPPFSSFYFGYYGGRCDNYDQGHHGHHGWQPYGYSQMRQNGVTTLKYGSVVHATPSHVDVVRSTPQSYVPRMTRENSGFRPSDSPQTVVNTGAPSIREQAARSVAGPVRSPAVEREVPRPERVAPPIATRTQPDSPRASSPAPRPSGASRGGWDSPRASSPPPQASASSPSPSPRAPASSSPSRGGPSGRGR